MPTPDVSFNRLKGDEILECFPEAERVDHLKWLSAKDDPGKALPKNMKRELGVEVEIEVGDVELEVEIEAGDVELEVELETGDDVDEGDKLIARSGTLGRRQRCAMMTKIEELHDHDKNPHRWGRQNQMTVCFFFVPRDQDHRRLTLLDSTRCSAADASVPSRWRSRRR